MSSRPLCADVSRAADEPLSATASRIEHWLLVEYAGHWPYDPLDAAIFAGGLGERVRQRLRGLRNARLCLVKGPGRGRRDRVRVVWGAVRERGSWFRQAELSHHGELGDVDPSDPAAGEPLEAPVLLVCTHGVRDRCCAVYGQELCRALSTAAPPGWAWQASHVGGDRFAGNLVALPEGLYFGRVGRTDLDDLLARYRDGRIALDRYRGRACHPFPVQAAELAVRRETGLDGIHDLRLASGRRTGDEAWTVELDAEVSGERWRAEVGVEHGEEAYLTCRAAGPRRARRFVARAVARL